MLNDLRTALRALARAPRLAVVVTLTFALGLAANTTVFAAVNALLLRPLGFPHAERLVDVHEESATRLCEDCAVGSSWETYLDWRARTTVFASLGAYLERDVVLGGAPGAERVPSAAVSPTLFPMLGAPVALGRALDAADERRDAAAVVVVSHALWQRRFGGDTAIVGHTLRVNGAPHTIVGVVGPRFHFPAYAQLWTPLGAAPPDGGREARDLGVVGLLRAGTSRAAADAQLASVAAGLAEEHPAEMREWSAGVTPLRHDLAGEEASLGWALLGAVLLVQLVVCANVAGLLLARAADRRRELAVRAALGASRRRLARQLLVEVGVLAAIGAGLGFWIAALAVQTVAARAAGRIPYWIDLRVDWRVAAFCAALTVVAALVSGLGIALRASRPNVRGALQEAGPNASATRRQGRVRTALVVTELASALVLLAAAGLLVQSVARHARPEEGALADRLVAAEVRLLGERYADASQVREAAVAMLAAMSRVPGVERAAVTRFEFLAGFAGSDQPVTLDGGRVPAPGASPRFAMIVSPQWRATRGLALQAGRDLADADRAGAAPVALVNAAMAERLWPGASPLGQRVKLGPPDSDRPWVTVVGVLANAANGRGGRTTTGSMVYVPFAQWPGRPVSVLARAVSADAAERASAALPGALRAVLVDEPVDDAVTVARGARERVAPQRMLSQLLGGFAAFALLIAAVGVFGVVSASAAQRTREIGLRVALGATPQQVAALLSRRAGRMVLVGVALGLVGALAASRAMRALLFGADPLNLPVLLGVSALLAGVSLLAGWLPARRASRMDPVRALREER
jgi:putative ABC transport system permease protein